MENSEKLFYMPDIKFYHPQSVIDHASSKTVLRSFTYRCGFAKGCIKHRLYFRVIKRLLLVAAYLPYCIFFNRRKTRFYLAEVLGIFAGIVVK